MLLDRVRAGGLLGAGSPVVVLLSGGRDSVCLLDVAVELAGAEAVTALHVDHGLRPRSAADAAACATLCDRLGVELVQHRAGPRPGSGNVQAWARAERYGAAERVAAPRQARLATAHTATDQAETILYRLAASPGRGALLGMPDEAGALVRPLLRAGVTRQETAAWCAARGLAWLEDPSNADDRYARTRVREGLVPALRAVHPQAEANVAAHRRAAARGGRRARRRRGPGPGGRSRWRWPPRRAAAARWPGWRRRLAEGAPAGRARAAARLDDVLALDPSGAALDVGDGARAVVRDGVLRFTATPPRPVAPRA